jgi:DNA-binding transcriptional LysR family regulator
VESAGISNVTALRVFAAAAAEGSFSAAARRLGISQPSVSEHIQSLEAQHGLQLFDRAGREMRLTRAGVLLYEHSARVLAALEDLERDLRALREGKPGTLDIVANPIPGEAVLPLLLPRFRELEPKIQVRERIGSTRDVLDRLLRRDVELGIVVGPFYDERLEIAFLARDEFALIARPDHPLAGRGPLRLAEVCQYPLVLRREGSGTGLVVETALLAAGVDRASITVAAELGNTSAVRQAVIAGLGVAFVSYCALAEHASAEFVALPLADDPPARDLLVVTERGRTRTLAAENLRRFLLSSETLREVAGHTRLPAELRPARARDGDPLAAPETVSRSRPLAEPSPIYRLRRLPRTPEETLVARLLGETYRRGRAGLLERLADELRRRAPGRLPIGAEAGLYGLQLYDDEAEALIDRLAGDLLVEVDPDA